MVKFKMFFLIIIAIDFLEEKGANENLTHTELKDILTKIEIWVMIRMLCKRWGINSVGRVSS